MVQYIQNEFDEVIFVTIDSFIEKYRAVLLDGNVYCPSVKGKERDLVTRFIFDNKKEILAKLGMTEQRKAALRELGPGILAITTATQELDRRRFSSVDLTPWSEIPAGQKDAEEHLSSLKQEYPRAAAYLRARRVGEGGGNQKRAAGIRAAMNILDGGDIDFAIDRMLSECREWFHIETPPRSLGADVPYTMARRSAHGARM